MSYLLVARKRYNYVRNYHKHYPGKEVMACKQNDSIQHVRPAFLFIFVNSGLEALIVDLIDTVEVDVNQMSFPDFLISLLRFQSTIQYVPSFAFPT